MENEFKIYELKRQRSGAVSYAYFIYAPGADTRRAEPIARASLVNRFVACSVRDTGRGLIVGDWTGDASRIAPGLPGYAFLRDTAVRDVPEWIRPAFIDWKAAHEPDATPESASADRVKFNREDGLYYAIVGGHEFGGWHTRAQAATGLMIEQRRAADRSTKAADRATSEPASSADEHLTRATKLKDELKRRGRGEGSTAEMFLADLDPTATFSPETVDRIGKLLNDLTANMYFAAGFKAYLDDETPGRSGDFTDRGQVERARRRAVMKIDEITRAAIAQLDAPRFGNCKGKGGKCPAYTSNKSEVCDDCLADLSEALKSDNERDEAAEYARTPRKGPDGWHNVETGSAIDASNEDDAA